MNIHTSSTNETGNVCAPQWYPALFCQERHEFIRDNSSENYVQAVKGEIYGYQVLKTGRRSSKVIPASFIVFVNLLIPCQTLTRTIIINVWYDICKFPKVMKLDETTFGGHVRFLELGTRWFRI